jgi:hypothetical protein
MVQVLLVHYVIDKHPSLLNTIHDEIKRYRKEHQPVIPCIHLRSNDCVDSASFQIHPVLTVLCF